MKNVLATGLAVLGLAAFSSASAATVVASDDAHIRGGTFENTNFGSTGGLLLKSNATIDFRRKVFVKFDVSAFSNFSNSMFSLFSADNNGDFDIEVYAMDDAQGDGWDESTITWANAPAFNQSIDDTAGGTLIGSYTVNDTDPVGTEYKVQGAALDNFLNNARGADGLVTFIIITTNTTNPFGMAFGSQNNGNAALRPVLNFDSNTVAPIPLPAAVWLFGAGAAGLGALRRSKKTA